MLRSFIFWWSIGPRIEHDLQVLRFFATISLKHVFFDNFGLFWHLWSPREIPGQNRLYQMHYILGPYTLRIDLTHYKGSPTIFAYMTNPEQFLSGCFRIKDIFVILACQSVPAKGDCAKEFFNRCKSISKQG